MSVPAGFRRTTPTLRCPVCARPDWCLISVEGGGAPTSAVCARIESSQRFGEAGWLHQLGEGRARELRRGTTNVVRVGSDIDFGDLADRFVARLPAQRLHALARDLHLAPDPLACLRVGWTGSAFSFPMVDARARVIGIRLRFPDGGKRAIKDSRQGLFVPIGEWNADPLWITEGPTDAAALVQLGLRAVGRPSCNGGRGLLQQFVRRRRVGRVVVVADADGPGRRGAEDLARHLAALCRDVRVVEPPSACKDARDAVIAGATAADFEHRAAELVPWRMTLAASTRRKS